MLFFKLALVDQVLAFFKFGVDEAHCAIEGVLLKVVELCVSMVFDMIEVRVPIEFGFKQFECLFGVRVVYVVASVRPLSVEQ